MANAYNPSNSVAGTYFLSLSFSGEGAADATSSVIPLTPGSPIPTIGAAAGSPDTFTLTFATGSQPTVALISCMSIDGGVCTGVATATVSSNVVSISSGITTSADGDGVIGVLILS